MGIERISEIWPEWKVTELIGEGTLAKVYKAVCEDTNEETAIKVVSLPQSEADIDALRKDGMSDIEIISYYSDIVNDIVTELKLAQALKDAPNIVKLYDYNVLEREGSIGWDIFIRTELLVSMNKYMALCPVTEADTVKLASDIAAALEYCESINVIHRDIKPESLFVSVDGDFKLTDFTITKDNGQTGSALSTKGGFVYLAPEIVSGGEYDTRADIYSLGLLMYKLCNGGYMPFVDENSSYDDRKLAVDRRLDGESLPEPRETTPELSKVILKACAFDPRDRYATAAEFRAALDEIKSLVGFPIIAVDYQTMVAAESTPVELPGASDIDPTVKLDIDVPPADDEFTIDHSFSYDPPIRKGKQKDKQKDNTKDNKKTKMVVIITLCSIAAVVLIAILLRFLVFNGNNKEQSDPVTVSDKIITLLSEDKFDEVTDLYNKYRGDKSKLYGAFMTRLDQIYEEYKTDAYAHPYADVIAELDFIESLEIAEISSKLASVRANVEALNTSRIAYDTGVSKETAEDYIAALENFSLVIPEDEANYADAQKRIESLIATICSEADSKANSYYPDAIEYIMSAAQILPDDETLNGKLEELKAAYLVKLCDEADEMIDNGEYKNAFDKLNYALSVLGESEEISDRINEIVSRYLDDIQALIDAEKFEEAKEEADAAIAIFQDNADAYDQLIAKKNEIIEAQYLHALDQLMTDKSYDEARLKLDEALAELPESEKLIEFQEGFITRIETDFSLEINSCINRNSYVEAKELLNQLSVLCPDSAVISELQNDINEGVDTYYTSEITALLAEYDFDSATEMLNEALALNAESEDLQTLQTTIVAEMEQFYIDEAQSLMDNYDYYGAVAVLEEANERLPENEAIMNKLTELEEEAPVDLAEISCPDSSYIQIKNSKSEDNFGNEYARCISFNANKEAHAEYELNGDYSQFTATIFTTSNMNKSIYIYFDGSSEAAYVYTNMTNSTEPISLKLDVNGVQTMRIEVDGSAFAINDRYVELGNPVLYY